MQWDRRCIIVLLGPFFPALLCWNLLLDPAPPRSFSKIALDILIRYQAVPAILLSHTSLSTWLTPRRSSQAGASVALMLASNTLDRSDSVSPLVAEKSWRKLARRDCLAWGVVSGGQEVGRFWQDGKGARPLGIGVGLVKGFEERWRVVLEGYEIRRAAEYVLTFVSFVLWPFIQPLLLQHLFSFLCPSIPSFWG